MSFKKLKKYKEIDSDVNMHFVLLSMKILSTINYMYSINSYYDEYQKIVTDKYSTTLNIAFNDVKNLLFLRFANQMREYSGIMHSLFSLNNKPYNEIDKYIEKTSFLKSFLKDKDKFNALSLALHNFSKAEFDKEQYDRSFIIYGEYFNKAFVNNDINKIKKEFENVISLFRKIDKIESQNVSLHFIDCSYIFELINLIIKIVKAA